MTEDTNSISRRNVLAGLGTIGVGGALVGAGTSALFSDEVEFDDNQLVAGELDLKLDWQQLYYGAPDHVRPQDYGTAGRPYVNAHPDEDADADLGDRENGVQSIDGFSYYEEDRNVGDDEIDYCEKIDDDYYFGDSQDSLVKLDDIKPGDCWETTFSLHLCDNPGWVWMGADLELSDDGNHFVDEADAKLWYDMEGNNEFSEGDQLIVSGTLRDVFDALSDGILLDGSPDGTKYGHDTSENGTERACIALEKIDDDNIYSVSGKHSIDDLDDDDELTFTHDGRDITIELDEVYTKDDGEVTGFEWTETTDYKICRLEMFGGSNLAVENYDPCTDSGSLRAPENPGGQQAGLSNFTFAYCLTEDTKTEQKCFPNSTTQFVAFEWCLPIDTGNDIQGTSLDFDLQFYTEQCRHNDDPAENPI